MGASTPDEDQVKVTATAWRLLDQVRVIAMVGASPRPTRPSHGVMGVLLEHGYDVIPVTPNSTEIRGQQAYPDLASVPVSIDLVDIFRRSDRAGEHVDQAIAIGAQAVWLQLGVIDHDAAARARAAGLDVVMDRCPAIELRRRR